MKKNLYSLKWGFLFCCLLFAVSGTGCDTSGDDEKPNGPSVETPADNVRYKTYGLNFSPYMDSQDPNKGAVVSSDQISSRLQIIKPYTSNVRTFGCTSGLEKAGPIAHGLGLKAAVGAWIGSNSAANELELSNLIAVGKAGGADMLIVGSEALLRGDLDETQLIGYIDRVRQAVPGIPVSYADTYAVLLSHPAVIGAVDVVMVNYYPYWEGISIDKAIARIRTVHPQVVAAAGTRKVVVSETGWPSDGNQYGEAVPSLSNAVRYFSDFVAWARANNVEYYYFEAFDEAWKADYEGPQGAHWGLWDRSGILKSGMAEVFNQP
jgi:exo-beta-1,3-glucanase (GH17 family)